MSYGDDKWKNPCDNCEKRVQDRYSCTGLDGWFCYECYLKIRDGMKTIQSRFEILDL